MANRKQPTAAHGHSRGSRLLLFWRKKARLTQRDACSAGFLDIDSGRYSALETGRERPGLRRAGKIQEVTGGIVPALSWLEPDCGPLVEEDEHEARAS